MSTSTLEAPATHPDSVYHLTAMKKIGAIASVGLKPDTERGKSPEWKELERLLDEERPESVVALGITRKQAVFAHPDIDRVGDSNTMGAYNAVKDGDRSVAVRIVVDNPEKALVGDAYYLDDIYRNITESDPESARQYARKYWENTVTLADYRRYYHSTYEMINGQMASEHVRDDNAPRTMPFIFTQPEVLLPGLITPDHLEWAASNVAYIQDEI